MTYLGPSSRLDPRAAFTLGPRWAYQPKLDGCYASARLDAAGRIASVTSRAGRELPEGRELLGLLAGPPDSVLVGELEAHTEAGTAAYRATGYRRLHLFDCLSVRGCSLAAAPYLTRWQWLHEIADDLRASGAWQDDERRRAHAADGTGRYVRRPERHLPIVPLIRGHEGARELWRDVERGTLEGLVAVALDAPAGRRGAKRKVKPTDTADCRVLAVSPGVLHLSAPRTSPAGWRGGSFLVGSVLADRVTIGAIVEVRHDGWYRTGEPRFARVVRVRDDLSARRGRVAA